MMKKRGDVRVLMEAMLPEVLDEPIAGMNTDEIEFTLSAILKTREQGVTIVLVEHNMRIMDLCDRVSVISFGRNIAEGTPSDVRNNREVIEPYLGGEHVA